MLKRIGEEIYFFVLIIALILLFAVNSQAQGWDAPKAYTAFAGFRLYDDGDNAGSDSLNQNMIDADALLKAQYDTLNAVKADVYAIIDYSGGIRNGSVMFDDLSTSAKASLMQIAGTQTITGTKTFANSYTLFSAIYPRTNETYVNGIPGARWISTSSKNIYCDNLVINNPTNSNDTVFIGYNGNQIDFHGKKVKIDTLNISTKIIVDSAAAFNSLKLLGTAHSFGSVADSVIELTSLMSNVRLNPPGNMSNVEALSMVGASTGSIIILWNYNTLYSITLEDSAPDGNLQLAGNFTLSAGDCITLMYYYDQPNLSYKWMEVSRSNN